MPNPKQSAKRRAVLPSPRSVVAEMALLPARRPAVRTRLASAAATTAAPAYRIIRTNEVDPYDKPIPKTAVPSFAATAAGPPGDDFKGTSRKVAKLSLATAGTEKFQDVKDLIATLAAEKGMIKHKPKITTDKDSDRVAEEKRNVQVRAFLYAASREDDNDYHLIVGRKPAASPTFMTVEISGLPPKSSKHHAKLKAARDAYTKFFKDGLPGPSYDFYDPPIPVELTGSLFFDMSHATGGRPGPKKLRPNIPTIWEIHPISKVVFEP